MSSASVPDRFSRLNFWLLLLLAFCLPLSTSAISVLAILVSLSWLLEGRYLEKFTEIRTNPVCLAVVGYLLLMVVGLLWAEDLRTGIQWLGKHWKIMLMPLFLTAVIYERRRWYLAAFLAGISVAMAMTYLAWFDLLHYADVSPEHLTKKTFHVVYNPLLAFAIYTLCHELTWGRPRGGWRLAGWCLAGVMVFNMFITEGRAGQLVFFALLALYLFQLLRRQLVAALLLVAVLLPLSFSGSYLLSPMFKARVDLACEEIRQFELNPQTSVGFRLHYWQNSWEMIKAAPLMGVGTGDFKAAYARINQQRSPQVPPTDNPHNQYVLAAASYGALGLCALLAIFFAQFRQAGRDRDGLERLGQAFPLFFLVIMLTESYLVVYQTGFLFSLLSAVLYKQSSPLTDQGGA